MVMCRSRVTKRIDEKAKLIKVTLRNAMAKVQHIATTTDCWTARHRSYIGVTAHWIDNETLQRISAAFASKASKGQAHLRRVSIKTRRNPCRNPNNHSNAYMGYLAPTISLLKEKLHKKNFTIPSLKPLNALLSGLDKRFNYVFDNEKIIAAAIVHPKFKNTWTNDQNALNKGKYWLLKIYC